jgi:ferredoxin-type protein NapH
VDPKRLKVLKAFRRLAPRHRYNVWRVVGLAVSMGILLLIPLSGLVRLDLWRGNHLLLFERAPFNVTLAVVIGIFCLIYAATFLINLVAGRMFCGWGCPIGQLHRLTESPATPGLTRAQRWRNRAQAAAFAFLLPASVLVWWLDWRILFAGSTAETLAVGGTLVAGTALALTHGRWWSWGFCRQACPIGLYYSFVAPARWFGITFQRPDTCIECNLCDHVCPVDLLPRSLPEPIPSRGGLSIADAPGRNHCLECGDCVRACEWIVQQKTGGIAPLELGFHGSPPRGKEPNEFATYCSGA